MFEFVLLDSHQCNRFLGEPAISNFYPRLPRKSRLKLYKEAGRPLCNQTVNRYRDCIGRNEWRKEWSGRRGRVLDAPLLGNVAYALKVLL